MLRVCSNWYRQSTVKQQQHKEKSFVNAPSVTGKRAVTSPQIQKQDITTSTVEGQTDLQGCPVQQISMGSGCRYVYMFV